MNDLTLYKIAFNEKGYLDEVKQCIDIAFDWMSGIMHDVLCNVISQCSEAANVMIITTQKQVKEISRTINDEYAELEVGIDPADVVGNEQTYVRVMVTLYGNGEVWARPGAVAWTKHVNTKRQNHVKTEYRLPFFEQKDNSKTIMVSFEHDMKKHIRDFLNRLTEMINAIDCSKYLI